MLVTTKKLLSDAYKNKYAVAAFNVYNLETLHAAVKTAEREQFPVIIAVGEKYFNSVNVEAFTEATKILTRNTDVPLGLHLDHAYDISSIIRAIQNGFTSVMFDGSNYPIEKNVQLTKKVTEIAHSVNVSVEGEIGSIERGVHSIEEVGDGTLTDPDIAKFFVNETKVDFLAAAIGTVHGISKGKPNIDLDRLELIHKAVDIPLVLHGGSGIPKNKVLATIDRGISKINVNTEISMAAVSSLRNELKDDSQYPHLSSLMANMSDTIENTMCKFVKLYKNQKL